MTVSVREAIMDAGYFSADVTWAPDVVDLLTVVIDGRRVPRLLHAMFYRDGALAYPPFVLRSVAGDDHGLTIGGPGVLWHLGSDGAGPMIDDREYLSGADKLGNPTFALDPADTDWATGDTRWVIYPGFAVVAGAAYDVDQVLASDEPFRAVAGADYKTVATIRRESPGLGRLRLRHVYSPGPFAHKDQMPAYSRWDASTGTSLGSNDIVLSTLDGAPALKCGPSGMPNLVVNGEFDSALTTGWSVVTGTWGRDTDGGWNGANYCYSTNASEQILSSTTNVAVAAGEEYEMRVVARVNPGSPTTDGEAWATVALAVGAPPYTFVETPHLASGDTDWHILLTRFTIPAGVVSMTMLLHSTGTTGRWDFDTATLIRTKGNLDFITSPIAAITPERSYRWDQPVRTDVGYAGGVSMAAVCFVATRPAAIIQGPELRPTNGADEVQVWEFAPPSGMDVVMARIVCQDVTGGAAWLRQGTIRQADTTTAVLEAIGPLTSAGETLTLTSTAPAGAAQVHLEVAAETLGIGWVVSALSLLRVTPAPAAGNTVVADLLSDAATGLPLSLSAGTITCPETIPYDWRQLELDNRSALDHFCSVVSDPVREYRVTATDPPALDVGTQADVFTVRPLAEALLEEDLDVLDIRAPEVTVEARATQIRVIGAERRTVSGATSLITATADVPGAAEVDYNGNPVRRVRVVSDGTVDHRAFAQALADDLASQEADPPLSVQARLNELDAATAATLGVTARPALDVGDTIYAYKPSAGLVGTDAVVIRGRTVRPRAVRALGRERALGPDYTLRMRRSDGSSFELAGVIWAEADETVLTLGDRLTTWQADPQGTAAGRQYLSDRASRPR